MNFDHVNKISDYTREQLMPHLASRLTVSDFGYYLSRVVETQSCRWMKTELRAYPITYFVDPVEFAKKYAKKCVAFTGTLNPQEGVMNIIYQVSPTLHVLARLYHWIEHDKVRAYLMLSCAYRDQSEYLEFFDENKSLRLTGNTEEKALGFHSSGQSDSVGIENLLKNIRSNHSPDEDDNPEQELNR